MAGLEPSEGYRHENLNHCVACRGHDPVRARGGRCRRCAGTTSPRSPAHGFCVRDGLAAASFRLCRRASRLPARQRHIYPKSGGLPAPFMPWLLALCRPSTRSLRSDGAPYHTPQNSRSARSLTRRPTPPRRIGRPRAAGRAGPIFSAGRADGASARRETSASAAPSGTRAPDPRSCGRRSSLGCADA
jgi:hypothetical protein